MAKQRKSQAPVRLELSGDLFDSISRTASNLADFVEVILSSLMQIVVALTDAAVRRLRR